MPRKKQGPPLDRTTVQSEAAKPGNDPPAALPGSPSFPIVAVGASAGGIEAVFHRPAAGAAAGHDRPFPTLPAPAGAHAA